jgi:hypothetical protein
VKQRPTAIIAGPATTQDAWGFESTARLDGDPPANAECSSGDNSGLAFQISHW